MSAVYVNVLHFTIVSVQINIQRGWMNAVHVNVWHVWTIVVHGQYSTEKYCCRIVVGRNVTAHVAKAMRYVTLANIVVEKVFRKGERIVMHLMNRV